MALTDSDVVYSVTDLNRAARALLEDGFPSLWLEAELSNFLHHGSGHMYFDLKDAQAQLRGAMFRGANRRLTFKPGSGQQVLVRGRLTLYEPRGSYQLVVEHMEPAGEGKLRLRFEALKAKLSGEGLFAEEHKQAIPTLPRSIGLITSPSGAAVRDILKVLRRRFAAIPIVLYPSPVQGDGAAERLAAALGTAAARRECDVLIIGRGGGSLEDLWAFNEEALVRAIHTCQLPVIAGVGHETDITLADLAADLRAPTPSAAAELAVPDGEAWLGEFDRLNTRVIKGIQRLLDRQRAQLTQLQRRLTRSEPGYVLRQHAQRLDELTLRLTAAQQRRAAAERLRLKNLSQRLVAATPAHRLGYLQQQLNEARRRLLAAVRARLSLSRQALATTAARLNAVSPLATLERGYAVVTNDHGKLVTGADQLKAGDKIDARLATGRVRARVEKTSDR